MPGALSEDVVPASHTAVVDYPASVEALKRILHEHLRRVGLTRLSAEREIFLLRVINKCMPTCLGSTTAYTIGAASGTVQEVFNALDSNISPEHVLENGLF